MPIQFPSNPTLNQSYTYNSRTWTWSGTKWVLQLAQQLQVDWAETDNTQLDFIKNKPNIPSTITWQTPQTANFTAVANRAYPVDTTSSAITVNLPQNPSRGDQVQLLDYAGTWASNIVTVSGNGNKINKDFLTTQLNTSRGTVSLVYIDSTQGWAGESAFAINTIKLTPSSVEALVVGGGGGGGQGLAGYANGGGGGAGGYRYFSSLIVSSGVAYPISIGAGGANNSNGTDSSFSSYYSAGGGKGGGSAYPSAGGSGGSGGGGSGGGIAGAGGSGNTPSVTPSQGNSGGAGLAGGTYLAGGGGGAQEAGNTDGSGQGGDGLANAITGISVYYAGGGGGASASVSGIAGDGGGGAGGVSGGVGGAGTANTGGGGGGGTEPSSRLGGTGGSGIVIIAYPSTFGDIAVISGGLTYTLDTTTRSGYKVYTFTAGTGTISW